MFYPNTVATENRDAVATITIKDSLANNKLIAITTHQLPIMDSSISIATLSQHNTFLDCFEGLKEKLIVKLKESLF